MCFKVISDSVSDNRVKMNFLKNSLILLGALLCYLLGCTAMNKCMPSLHNKIDIHEVYNDPKEARSIYHVYGIGNKKGLCKSIDDKTRRIRGIGFCKQAVRRLELANPNEDVSASCLSLSMFPKDDYKHAEIVFHRTSGGYTTYNHLLVQCKSKVSDRVLCHIMHCKDDYYYIFDKKPYAPDISGCLKIDNIQGSDYPPISIKETQDDLVLDDIFGFYEVLPTTGKGNVCYKLKNGEKSIHGDKVCKKLLNSQYLNEPTLCFRKSVHRWPASDYSFGWKSKIPVYGARCLYKDHSSKQKEIWIFNVPKQNYYYAAKPDNKNSKLLRLFKIFIYN